MTIFKNLNFELFGDTFEKIIENAPQICDIAIGSRKKTHAAKKGPEK